MMLEKVQSQKESLKYTKVINQGLGIKIVKLLPKTYSIGGIEVNTISKLIMTETMTTSMMDIKNSKDSWREKSQNISTKKINNHSSESRKQKMKNNSAASLRIKTRHKVLSEDLKEVAIQTEKKIQKEVETNKKESKIG